MPVTMAGGRGPRIWKARVLDVNVSKWTVSVASMGSVKKTITDIPFGSPYQHQAGGEGISFMPEVGSFCWVCEPSDGNTAFVMVWAPLSDEGDFRNNKPELNPGDIYLGTRDGNAMYMRRGGVVQIKTAGLAQRLFLPINNWIKDFCENFGLYTLGGDLEWTVDRPETTTDGKRPSRLRLSAREFAKDPKPIAVLEIGSHEDDDKAILSLNIYGSGEEGAELKVSMILDKEGNASFTMKKSVSWTIGEDLTCKVGGTATVEATKVVLKAPTEVGDATYDAVLNSPDFATWVQAVTAALGASPGSPAVQVALVAPTAHIATKLKAS